MTNLPAKSSITTELKAQAAHLGFDLCGVCPAVAPPGVDRLHAWLAAGYAGQMHYLPNRAEAASHPQHVLEGARSIVMLAMNYRTAEPADVQLGQGRVSRYAWGADYHDLIRGRLTELTNWLKAYLPGVHARGVVDTAPLLEREFAQLAGLGWIGKNTLLLNKQLGSWLFLAALLTDAELEYDTPHETDHCGTCRACLDACPTGAFVDAYVLDARRCISYLTIELRESIPEELRSGMGQWLFGCDVCQDVCPWNHRAPVSTEPAFQPTEGMNAIDLAALFDLDDTAFRARFRHTPLWRAKRRGLLRNAAMVLGNHPDAAGLCALMRGLNDSEPLVRAACAWALGNFKSTNADEVLKRRRKMEPDDTVLAAIAAALRSAIIE
ncbi:MAG TPA: tRNA epoxyqueuosine(34) reductase QueG [Pirellulales bacterium]|nr:tRNA epoxyqueuosine(34) reductase QueG [Pirellulales bacterium]